MNPNCNFLKFVLSKRVIHPFVMKKKDHNIELLKHITGVCSKFGHNKDLFFQKISEIIRINSLKEKQIIKIKETEFDSDIQEAIKNNKLSKSDTDLLFLMKQGFLYEEISVIMGYKNVNSVYKKRSRLKNKLKGSVTVEALTGMFIAALIVYLVLVLVAF